MQILSMALQKAAIAVAGAYPDLKANLIASRYQLEQNDFFELETPESERKPVKVSL